MNEKFTTRHRFIHVFHNKQIVELKVDTTASHVRFHFVWTPKLQSRRQLQELSDGWNDWVNFWLGGEICAKHGLHNFMFCSSCQMEITQQIAMLPP